MSDYTLRNVDPILWRQVKAQAALEGLSVRQLIHQLLAEWLKKGK